MCLGALGVFLALRGVRALALRVCLVPVGGGRLVELLVMGCSPLILTAP